MGWMSQWEHRDLSKPTLREGMGIQNDFQGGKQEQAGGAELLIQSKQYQQPEFIHFSLNSTFCHCSETENPSPGVVCVRFYCFSGSGSLFFCPARHKRRRRRRRCGPCPATPAPNSGTPTGVETQIFSPRAEDVVVSLDTANERVDKKEDAELRDRSVAQ